MSSQPIVITEFSHVSRKEAIRRLQGEVFDILIIGGGITGASTARDAASRGLKVALVEAQDFAWGTSSRSSKLIHGGLRYLENFEFKLVFEALSERAHLLKTAPHLVRPLTFYLPIYQNRAQAKAWLISMGLWLYDGLALFRGQGAHCRLSSKKMLERIPFLNPNNLEGGFQYFDASMWDDCLCLDNLRSAHTLGAVVANYVKATRPYWEEKRIAGFYLRDTEDVLAEEFLVRAHRVISCTGPWTDLFGETVTPHWKAWLKPSKGIHLVFDRKRLPIQGAMVMTHPQDGRIAFVIERPDLGDGVAIVGTTDGPTVANPEQATIDESDVRYLMNLLGEYFPDLRLTREDIASAYVGVRPLMGSQPGSEAQTEKLQSVSREHYIDSGPGEVVFVAGGKYTTHRTMAAEIVNYTLSEWARSSAKNLLPHGLKKSQTKDFMIPCARADQIQLARRALKDENLSCPEQLINRYGSEALWMARDHSAGLKQKIVYQVQDPEGFPFLTSQLRHLIRTGMVMHLEDFYLRRVPLYMTRADHGLPWAEELAHIWAEEFGVGEEGRSRELARLEAELARRSAWWDGLTKETESKRAVSQRAVS